MRLAGRLTLLALARAGVPCRQLALDEPMFDRSYQTQYHTRPSFHQLPCTAFHPFTAGLRNSAASFRAWFTTFLIDIGSNGTHVWFACADDRNVPPCQFYAMVRGPELLVLFFAIRSKGKPRAAVYAKLPGRLKRRVSLNVTSSTRITKSLRTRQSMRCMVNLFPIDMNECYMLVAMDFWSHINCRESFGHLDASPSARSRTLERPDFVLSSARTTS